MEPRHDLIPAAAIYTLKNTIWPFPYLAVMGMIWGYLADASSGVLTGLIMAAVASIIIGTATTIFNGKPDERAVHTRDDPLRNKSDKTKLNLL